MMHTLTRINHDRLYLFRPVMNLPQSQMGWVCSYTPRELILAAGLTPEKLLTHANQDSTAGESLLPSSFCPYVRRLCSLCIQDAEDTPGHLLIVLSCDPMRRLADALSLYGRSQNVFRLDVPRRRDELAAEFLTSQLEDLKRELETLTGRTISDQDLLQAIQTLNHNRSLLNDISELRRTAPHLLPGSEFHSLVRFCESHHPDDVQQQLTKRLQELKNQSQQGTGWNGPRLLLTGSVLEEADVLHRIEEKGAQVVCDDTCSGEKDLNPLVDTQGPPLESLARRMLQRPPCPRMLGSTERIQRVARLAADHNCDGVVAHTLKFCDLTQADLPRLEKTLTESGIPLLHLEQDSLSEDRGQLATRIQAFMETL